MIEERRQKIEYGDFQTPLELAQQVCESLSQKHVAPDTIIEPTCGIGAFISAAARSFPTAKRIEGFEVNTAYLNEARRRSESAPNPNRIKLHHADFFSHNWHTAIASCMGHILVLGNPPWVTNAGVGAISGTNLPKKSNFLGHTGFDAITGKANFDISEWMLIDILRWVTDRSATIAVLVKTAVARKVIGHAERMRVGVREASITRIDTKKHFGASVDACLLHIEIGRDRPRENIEYLVYDSFTDREGRRVGHRGSLKVSNLEKFDRFSHVLGESPQKWRSGVKHDASDVMEFTRTAAGLVNGEGDAEVLELEYLYPLLKGSDIGSSKPWREKFVLVTQRWVGESTAPIRTTAPKTWRYLQSHATRLSKRGSSIYKKDQPFAIFGIGPYAFKPWKIGICGLYKKLGFRLVGPIEGRPVMFDDTVYFVSFDTEHEAITAYQRITNASALGLLESLIFWDEKRPIKSTLLNVIDWNRVAGIQLGEQLLITDHNIDSQ